MGRRGCSLGMINTTRIRQVPARVPKMSGRAREIERFRFARMTMKLLHNGGRTYKTIPRPPMFDILVSCYGSDTFRFENTW